MVQPIMTSMGRTAKIFNSTGNRILSETFKDKNGVTTVVTRVLNKDNDVVTTRMKRIFQFVSKSGNKVFTRQDETHIQEKIAGTQKPKQGLEFVNKLFTLKEKYLSKDGKLLLHKELSYKKPHSTDLYYDKIKLLKNDKLSSATFYEDSRDVSEAIRSIKVYGGEDANKLQYQTINYNYKGLPEVSNEFNLKEFEMFNK